VGPPAVFCLLLIVRRCDSACALHFHELRLPFACRPLHTRHPHDPGNHVDF
jgi:hypothetical protein